jgi:hypothetical protein
METMLTSLGMLSDVMLLDVAATAAEAADAAATALFTANNIWMMLSDWFSIYHAPWFCRC